MQNEEKIEQVLRGLVFPILALVFAVQAYACRGLYGDGVNDFLNLLQHKDFLFWDRPRITNHIIAQIPIVLLLKLGVHNLALLRYVFSGWLLLRPLLVWGAALWVLRRDILFWPFLSVFCFIYFCTDFFAIGEYGLCFALAAFCFALLMRPLPATLIARATLMLAAALMICHYPSTLFFGPLLFLLVLVKSRAEWNGASQVYKIILCTLFALSTASALYEVIAPRDPANMQNAGDPSIVLEDVQFRCMGLYVMAVASLFCVRKDWAQFWAGALCVVLLVAVVVSPMRLYPVAHYAIRAYAALALTACGIGLWWLRRLLRYAPSATHLYPAGLVLLLLAVLAWLDAQMSFDYAAYLDEFRASVNHRTGLVPYARSGFAYTIENKRFFWVWSYPALSIVLRQDTGKAIILNPDWYHGYQPFDPVIHVPDLTVYYQ